MRHPQRFYTFLCGIFDIIINNKIIYNKNNKSNDFTIGHLFICSLDLPSLVVVLTALLEARRSEVIVEKVGRSLTMECLPPPNYLGSARETPLVVAADWYYLDLSSASVDHPSKGSLIEHRSDGRYTVINDSSLVIHALQPSDSGLYVCDSELLYLTFTHCVAVFNVSVIGQLGWFISVYTV